MLRPPQRRLNLGPVPGMSILGDTANAIFLIVVIAMLGVSGFLMRATGVMKMRSLGENRRIPAGQPAWYLAVVLCVAVTIWLAIPMVFGAIITLRHMQSGSTTQPSMMDFSPKEWAFLATVPPVAGLIALVAGDIAVGGSGLVQGLGFSMNKLPRGVKLGALGAVILLPIVWFVLQIIVGWLYELIGFKHPAEHELLLAMHDAHEIWVRVVLVLAAVLVAPLFEEMLFRGHLQTLLRRMVMRWMQEAPQPPPLPMPDAISAPLPLDYVSAQAAAGEANLLATWIAIFVTSILFTLVHPMWMWPAIFCLAIGLGYAYERTGNLWTCITIHCLFNSVSTLIFLLTTH